MSARDIKPPQWVNMVQGSWAEVQDISASQAKAEVLRILSQWQLFGSSFFAVSIIIYKSDLIHHINSMFRFVVTVIQWREVNTFLLSTSMVYISWI